MMNGQQLQYVCLNCGVPFTGKSLATERDGVIECKRCGYWNTMPRADQAEEVTLQLSHARHELTCARFDTAFSAYQKASDLAEKLKKQEPEAYFGMALAHYGVQYLYDEVMERNQPICYRVRRESFSQNRYLQKTLQYATSQQKEVYLQQAQEIDAIQDHFRTLRDGGVDYDVFLCVKVSRDGAGSGLTDDSHYADKIYDMLKRRGYRPFYSERQLTHADSIGKTYEPHILYALQRAKTMLIICSDESYLHTKWVHNEYMRYYRLMQQGKKTQGSLALVYHRHPIDVLPGIDTAGCVQGIDFAGFDASEQIATYIEHHVKESTAATRTDVPAEREAKYCMACGAENPVKVKFCGECGHREFADTYAAYEAAQVKKCPSCGANNPKTVKFCGECGMRFDAPNVKPTTAPTPTPTPSHDANAAVQTELEAICQEGTRLYTQGRYREAVEKYRVAAEGGYAAAQNNLGACYENGNGVTQDYQRATEWYQRSADQGYATAQGNLGACYERGFGVPQSYQKAAEYYQKAAVQGKAVAQNNLGVLYENGNGVPRDIQNAVMWYQKSAEQGYAAAQRNLGTCYYSGKGVERNYPKAAEWFQKAAEQGNVDSQFNLGNCYFLGYGVSRDDQKAVYWYQKAADRGSVAAWCNLGVCYETGRGLPQSYQKAIELYQKAADRGYAAAQNNLGICYYKGSGVAQNYPKAAELFQKAADQGHVDSYLHLGNCAFTGRGVPQDDQKAVYWYQKAADQGHARAQYSLGFCYVHGRGVTANRQTAIAWYQKAAENGDVYGQFNLAFIYENGSGLPRDLQKALAWYQKAAQQGHQESQKACERLKNNIK